MVALERLQLYRGLLERKVHHAVTAYIRPMPLSLGPPCEQWGTLRLGNPVVETALIALGTVVGSYAREHINGYTKHTYLLSRRRLSCARREEALFNIDKSTGLMAPMPSQWLQCVPSPRIGVRNECTISPLATLHIHPDDSRAACTGVPRS